LYENSSARNRGEFIPDGKEFEKVRLGTNGGLRHRKTVSYKLSTTLAMATFALQCEIRARNPGGKLLTICAHMPIPGFPFLLVWIPGRRNLWP
jgi:hypothetical protein